MNKTLSERFGIYLLINWQKATNELSQHGSNGNGYAVIDSWVMTYTGLAIGTFFLGVQRAQYVA